MGVKESVKKGFNIAKGSMNLIAVLFAFGAIWNVISVLLNPGTETPELGASAAVIVVGVLFVLISIFMQAGSLGYVHGKVKAGNADLGLFTASGKKYYVRLLLLGLLVAAIVGVLIFLAALAVALFAGNIAIIGVILALLLGAAAIYFAVMVFLAPYSIVSEDKGVLAAVNQSMSFVKKNILAVLGIALLLVLAGFVIGLLLGVVFGLLGLIIQGTFGEIVFAVLSSAVNSFLGVVVTGSFMSFYLGRNQASATGPTPAN